MFPRRLQLVYALAAALAAGPAFADADPPRDFTAEELQRLERGQLLSRSTAERTERGPLIGGTSWQVIDRPVDEVWNVLLDPDQYPRFLPQVTRAEVIRKTADERIVQISHGNSLLQIGYYLDVRIDAEARRISFRVD